MLLAGGQCLGAEELIHGSELLPVDLGLKLLSKIRHGHQPWEGRDLPWLGQSGSVCSILLTPPVSYVEEFSSEGFSC